MGSKSAEGEALRRELSALPGLEVTYGADLSRYTTFRIGGPAEALVRVETEEGLAALLGLVARLEAEFLLLGIGSNVLIPDEGLPGIVARLAGEFRHMRFDGTRVEAGGAVSLPKLARAAAGRGLVGLEALAGFPSSVGGAVHMNAGCYGTEIKDVLTTARVVGRDGRIETLAVEDLGAGYRTTRLQRSGQIVVQACFELARGDADAAAARIEELNRKRWQSLPSGKPNVGSIFRNPPGDSAGRLIDVCGLKGRRSGGARISPKHGNVIVNMGGARAEDVLALMEEARRAVEERFAVVLEPEVVLAGSLGERWRRRAAPAAGL